MHSVFAQNIQLKGDDCCDDIANPDYPVVLWGGICPVCQTETGGNSALDGSCCECAGVTWRLNITVTTEDLPPYASSISQVRTRALQVIAAGAAAKRNGKLCRELMKDLVKEFGRKAVEDAIPASGGDPGMPHVPEDARVALKRAPIDASEEQAQSARVITPSVVETLAPPTWWHCGQRPPTAPNLRRASLRPVGFDRQDNAQFEANCPKCYARFLVKTDTLRATCRCENVTWRMNVAIITHDFPPHAWHPETIRKTALRNLYARDHWGPCKASQKLLKDLKAEFDDGAVFCSILEV